MTQTYGCPNTVTVDADPERSRQRCMALMALLAAIHAKMAGVTEAEVYAALAQPAEPEGKD